MVASQATFLRAEQILVEGEERFVDLENVIVAVGDEVFDDHVKLVAVGERKAGLSEQIPGFLQRQLQRHGKGNGRGLGGPVLGVGTDLGKELPVHVGPLVTGGVGHAPFVDLPQQHLRKAFIQRLQAFVQAHRGRVVRTEHRREAGVTKTLIF